MDTVLLFHNHYAVADWLTLDALDTNCCSNWLPGWYHLTRPDHIRKANPSLADLTIVGPFMSEREAMAYR